MTTPATDEWSRWLLSTRYGNDPVYQQKLLRVVHQIADRVLDAARLRPNTTLVDVGAGDGLIAFRAIERVGPSLRVILTDISAALLEHAAARAAELGVQQQCTFLHCSAEDLDDLADAGVDTVTTRSVLAYVKDRAAALREFHRILKPNGTLSIAECILQDEAFEINALKRWLDSNPPANTDTRFARLFHRLRAAQFPSTDEELGQSPLTNFTERDLVRLFRSAGFAHVHAELHIDVTPAMNTSWNSYLNSAPHPLAPTPGVILAEQFSPEERAYFEKVMRPMIESAQSTNSELMAYLCAQKP